jgi:hypothetical protein
LQIALPAITRARLVRWLAVAFVLAAGSYFALTASRLVLVYREMLTAERQVHLAEALLRESGLDPSPLALARAEGEAAAAGSSFRSAEAFLEGNVIMRLAAELPWIGEQVATARDLAAIGYEGSRAGAAAASALRTLEEMSAAEDAPMGGRVIEFMDAVEPETVDVGRHLASIRERRDRIAGRHNVGPLVGLLARVDERLLPLEAGFRRYESARAAVPELLGRERPMTYLVLGLDNTELMPGGGIVGVYGLITFDNGRAVERSFHEVDEILRRWRQERGNEYIEPPGPLKRYLLRDWTWSFALAAWSPDFPTAARQSLFFYERSGGAPVDGVIGMDFAALEGLLSVLGPRRVEGYGVSVDASNVREETLLRAREIGRPQEESHAFARAVAATVVDGVLGADSAPWNDLLQALDGEALAKHLFLYATEPRLQRAVQEMGWTGEVKHPPGDYLMLVDASVNSTKLNLVLEESAELEVRLDWAGGASHILDLRYRNGLPQWARGRDPAAVERLMAGGLYGGYVRVFSPPLARLRDVRVGGESVGAEEVGREEGNASFGRYVPLPAGAQADVRFVYDVPGVGGVFRGRGVYRLLVQKQPGSAAVPFLITVLPPEGARVVSVSLDGRRLEGRTAVVATELSQDRELVVRYEW